MSRQISILTPENIEVSYELAGIGSRFISALVDHLFQLAALVAVGALAAELFGASAGDGSKSSNLYALAVISVTVFIIEFGYFTLFEWRWSGQTPGKRLVGLRVVRDGGYPIDFYSAVIRNLVRIVDLMPPPYGIGIVSIFVNREYKRVGDIAAGTIVIRDSRDTSDTAIPPPPTKAVGSWLPFVANLDLLTGGEVDMIARFLARSSSLSLAGRADIANRLAPPLIRKLGLDPPISTQLQYVDFLHAMLLKYHGEAANQASSTEQRLPRPSAQVSAWLGEDTAGPGPRE